MFERQVTCLVSGRSMETYHGHVRTPADAIILFEACRIGLLPRVQRRLSEKERASIRSGSVFVWDEREAGMRRWTDGKSWSASRVSGSFLTYREMEGKRSSPATTSTDLGNGRTPKGNPSIGRVSPDTNSPDGYRYKADGLMKQSFSISTSAGQHLHLISYYSRAAAGAQAHNSPSQDPRLRQIRPEKGMYPESSVHDHNVVPPVIKGPMASSYPAGSVTTRQPMYVNSPQRGSMSYYSPGPQYETSTARDSPQTSTRPPSSTHPPPLTAYDRPPAPLSSTAAYGASASPQLPYYSMPKQPYPTSEDWRRDHAYPSRQLPDIKSANPNTIPPLDLKDLEARQDSVLNQGSRQIPEPLPRSITSSPGSRRSPKYTIPSISALINSVSHSPMAGDQPRSAISPRQSIVDDIRLRPLEAASAQYKLPAINPDARALRDLDKVTFRI